jgi:hypothetical protein
MKREISDGPVRPKALHRLVALLLLTSFVVACHTLPSQQAKLPQEWNGRRGPVIPHDNFPSDCQLCHEPGSWHRIRKDIQFDHEAETGVPLHGAHRDAQCLRCHNDRGPVAAFAARGCVGCHQDIHRGQLGRNCEDCHNPNDWTPREQIARHNRTRFPLVGVHAGVACQRCHKGADVGNFLRAPTRCAFCHQADFLSAVSPNHKDLGWTDNCEKCHVPTSWQGASFTHDRFPLTGAHATTACNECHRNGVFQGLSQDCFSCHTQQFQATTMPNHASAGFSTDCKACHNTLSWATAGFDHSRFPLVGAHATVTCTRCHQNSVFAGLSHDCFFCHAQQYQATTMPDHAAAGFPTDCKSCHGTFSWVPAGFDHSRFPLTGAHTTVACAQCHQNGVYAGLAHDCFSCHSQQYQATTMPDHAAAGFPTDCQACHTTFAWQPAAFDHSRFPLTGAHATTDCAQCHQNGVYAGLSHDCFFCHSADYQQATNPDHANAGFPTTCQNCHNTTSWQDANFNHAFNISSGPHRSFNCAECHQVPNNFMIASCTHCHEHRQSVADDKHSGVPGYTWSSPACISCHPNGR